MKDLENNQAKDREVTKSGYLTVIHNFKNNIKQLYIVQSIKFLDNFGVSCAQLNHFSVDDGNISTLISKDSYHKINSALTQEWCKKVEN